MSAFESSIKEDALSFLTKMFKLIEEKNVDVSSFFMDHLCLRVDTKDQYNIYQSELKNIGILLIESMVNGRFISTFKLNNPIVFKERSVDIIELPEPKKNNKYEFGFEHAEFVIDDEFEEFVKTYSSLKFDWDGASKDFNPELRLQLDEKTSIKFHHQSLEKVVEIELAQRNS